MNTLPWPHILEEDWYDDHLFNAMRIELKAYALDNIRRQQTVIKDFTELPATTACISSRPITESILQQFPAHRSYKKLVPRHEIIFCVGDYSYPIHDEWHVKILSAVTYIFPDSGIGTLLYNEDKSYHSTATWKPNSTLIFPGLTGKTWHSYSSSAGSIRITQNTFLIAE